ncbi:sacsin N-terminal ATP-binding-like domain-containing protein [Nakamurella leprariae]|uniref:DEAD/DEAH box helicase family protein n=1 Tax=Nakamurella leprariae TaxID=2803911 RepID=A0A938YCU9_9ACTN|nr:DEAD/DEAH box helicase family protein [Nakamurella leprariae]MBM9467494.1 DEAD/DEAH box helicase family protein [Nakamurella leprariae]
MPDAGLVSEVEEQLASTLSAYRAQPKLIAEHANHEESMRTGGYAKRTLLELVQNAADALAGADESNGSVVGRVEIILDTTNATLYCANAGRPFSSTGVDAVTMAHLSEKRGDEIGRFGLGFKSVLAVTDRPQILSRSVAFEFNSARARRELAAVANARRYPILRTATPIDAVAEFDRDPLLAELAVWASTIVKLPEATGLDRLLAEMKDFNSEFLLFVGAVREVKLRVLGADPFETSHISRELGGGVLRIDRPSGTGDDWIVASRMHAPSKEARAIVGEAVSRDKVKVSVAIPAQQSRLRIGQFWSYFPLRDTTSASALFNAPWSVNDDRTNLLYNDYNREMFRSLAELFVENLPRVRTDIDPAAHLDYLPARGRGQESHGFGDENLAAHIMRLAGIGSIIPDSASELCNGQDLRPLDPTVRFDAIVHRGWSSSPNTGADAPHWRCYSNPTRATRLRDLFVAAQSSDIDPTARDTKLALERMPKRGLLSWLREWAEGDDATSAANALRTVANNLSLEDIANAKVIPTSAGMRSLADRSTVFLHREADLEIEGAAFVDPAFLAEEGVEELLRANRFRDLDPEAILNARLVTLPPDPDGNDLSRLWDAALEVSVSAAARLMQRTSAVKVPTLDGGWAWPRQVVDLDVAVGDAAAPRVLDRKRCIPDVALRLGVIREPVKSFAFEDEWLRDSFVASTLDVLNKSRGPGDRPIDSVEFGAAEGAGPASVLFLMRDADASSAARVVWTTRLLLLNDTKWECEDVDTGRVHRVPSPARWAVAEAGLLMTARGPRPLGDVVAPSLVQFDGLLPLYKGPSQALQTIDLPDELDDVPAHVLREALESGVFPRIHHDALTEFILAAVRIGLAGTKPLTIPAQVKQVIEAHAPSTVYLATTDEQENFLRTRLRPYLRVSSNQVDQLVELVGCRRFEDSFAFSIVIEGQQESQRILDVYTGLRAEFGSRLNGARVSRTAVIAKRVTTEDGVEDQPLDSHLDGGDLLVRSDVDDRQMLKLISDAFGLRLDNARLSAVLRAGLDHSLEIRRQQACTIDSDAERLDHYIGPDDLKDALPAGLWSALEAQGLVDARTSVAQLFLTVYGSDSLRMLQDRFRDEGFGDVPTTWAGSSSALSWVRKMGFGAQYAGDRSRPQPEEFVIAGAVRLNQLHSYQKRISADLRTVLTQPSAEGPAQKAMVELPTGAGKTRVATETVLRLFQDEVLEGPVLWVAQSAELCEQAVQTFQAVWRYLGDEQPLTIGRLWGSNTVHQPDTRFSVIVATDAKLESVMHNSEYEWLSRPAAVFVDEAHRAGASTRYTSILRWLGVDGRSWERPLVGLSATPFKGRAGQTSATRDLAARFGNKRLTAFESDAYRQLVQLEVLARVKHEVLSSGVDIELSTSERSKLQSDRLIDRNLYEKIGRNEQRMRVLVEHIMQQNRDWPILVFTPSVLSAQVLAASLRYRDVQAASVSGQTGRQERRDVLDRFRSGEIKVLANCDLLVQGFDAPGVRALYIARPTFSPGAYIQMAGRGLRGKENGGKEECLIVDVADNWGAMNDFLGYRDYEDLWSEQRG